MLRQLKRLYKRLLPYVSSEASHLRPTVRVESEWYGTLYGGFFINPQLINTNSIAYSIGIGQDISFDLELIKHHGCKVWGFDPTPKCVQWIADQQLPPQFSFQQVGLGTIDGQLDFFLPKNSSHISGSFCQQQNVNSNCNIQVQMKRLTTIANELGHGHIDILKMDIEGLEYEVIDSILESSISIGQICVEFHDRFFPEQPIRSKHAIDKLNKAGFQVFAVADSLEEVSLIHAEALTRL